MTNNGHRRHNNSTTGRFFLLQCLLGALSRLAPGLAARLAERLFLTPFGTRIPAREMAWESTARRVDVGPLAAWVWGSGPRTVLLVHGWSGRGLQLGAFVEPLVEQGFRVVAYDGPGHGRSAGRRSSLPELRAALVAMAREFAPVEAVIAHSLGGTATLWALARGELAATRAMLLASPARLHEVLARFSTLTGFSPAVVARMARRLAARFGFRWPEVEPLHLARGLTVPALVVHDRQDREIPFAEGRELATAWPGARFLPTEGLGHSRLLSDSRVIAAALGFLSANSVRHSVTAFPLSPGRPQNLPPAKPRAAGVGREPFLARQRLEKNMRSILTAIRRLVLGLTKVAADRLTMPLDPWDLQLSQHEIDRELAFGRD